jgi:hypothetical protein
MRAKPKIGKRTIEKEEKEAKEEALSKNNN